MTSGVAGTSNKNEEDNRKNITQKNRDLLLRAVGEGKVADFIQRKLISSISREDRLRILRKAPDEVIEAESIREALTGISRGGADDVVNFPKPTSAGVRLFGVTITGLLDLNDATGINGGPLPRLEFIGCWFEAEIKMERCHIRSLCVRGCAFTDLLASEAVIEGPVDISYARPTGTYDKDKARCWLVLAGSQIAGRFYAAHSHFKVAEREESRPFVLFSKHARYALDLRGTRIRGSVNLRPGLFAQGGVCMTLATVEGSISLNGANITAKEEWAFSAEYARIQGSLYFRPYDARPQEAEENLEEPSAFQAYFRGTGCVSLFAAQIGGSVYFEGAKLELAGEYNWNERWEKKTVINLSTAIVKGHCRFTGWISEAARRNEDGRVDDNAVSHFIARGDVLLAAAVIGNDLDFDGAIVHRILGNSLKVLGNCHLATYSRPKVRHSRPFAAIYRLDFDGAHIGGDLLMDGARIGHLDEQIVDFLVSTNNTVSIINKWELDQQFNFAAGKEIMVENSRLFADSRNGIFARGIDVKGNCFMRPFKQGGVFRFECAGRISMQEAKIGTSIYLDGAEIVGPEKGATIDLSGAHIDGQASFKTSYEDTEELGLPLRLWGGEIGLKLTGIRIGEELNMNGAKIRGTHVALNAENSEVGGKALLGTFEFYRGDKHQQFHFVAWGKITLVAATIKLGVDMSGAELNGVRREGGQERSSATDALDLTLVRTKSVRLCALKQCIDGPMHLAVTEKKFQANERVILKYADIDTDLDCDGSSFGCQLMIDLAKVGGSVILKNVEITSGMSKSRESNDKLYLDYIQRDLELADLSLNGVRVIGALRIGDSHEKSRIALKLPSNFAPGDTPVPFIVDLRGAHVGVLDDNNGTGWGRDLRLWLEGFRYTHLSEGKVVGIPHLKAASWFNWHRVWDPAYIVEETKPADFKGDEKYYSLWTYRAVWLRLQYFDGNYPSIAREFNPDAYEQVIARMKSTGSYEDANRISSIQLTNNKQNSLRVPSLVWHLFRVLFDYGFSARRAIETFVLCITIGVVFTCVANSKDVLILNVGAPEARLISEEKNAPIRALLLQPGEKEDREDVPCGNHILPLLYALDVFVPVLDLKQQDMCSISPNHPAWRLVGAFYSLLGWIISPLVILTSSGLMKRHLEK